VTGGSGNSKIYYKMESETEFKVFLFQGQAISLKEVCSEVLIKLKRLPSYLFNGVVPYLNEKYQ
jgi:hypothetical protein